ncbi:MAG TPA: RNA polymerase subunit sigma-70 [Lachnospiraceae bacterium]|nr:RNA polymerase subunit sigma-70 [Lachnospiraceae bacterium]
MKANEDNFVDLIRKRREEGILYVIETYGGLLKSIVGKRLFASPDRIEECMNDIFLGIWQNIGSFDPDRGSFVNWAAGVARLEAIDTLRKIQREHNTVSLEDMEIPEEDKTLLALTEQELSKETEEILSCLSPKDQELFRRIFLEEEEPEAAGSRLGISRDNVYVRIFRGKKKIRSKFGERKRA